ncbi:hypothetical protein BN11_1750003 [Nostocoides australiense Ben110]|uniref:Uncharacterized protein n=1 Tax=Nostocoides australiense Ben110 TaxID=1193182 RepID=W6JUF5_9MICO|nr:hypothetical protein BN11_1750003 [Tetrasphaera australiensis Ben110]
MPPFPPTDVEDRGSWRVTDVERTLVDVADGDSPQEIVDGAVAGALRLGKVSRRKLLRRAMNSPDRAAVRLNVCWRERRISEVDSSPDIPQRITP